MVFGILITNDVEKLVFNQREKGVFVMSGTSKKMGTQLYAVTAKNSTHYLNMVVLDVSKMAAERSFKTAIDNENEILRVEGELEDFYQLGDVVEKQDISTTEGVEFKRITTGLVGVDLLNPYVVTVVQAGLLSNYPEGAHPAEKTVELGLHVEIVADDPVDFVIQLLNKASECIDKHSNHQRLQKALTGIEHAKMKLGEF